MTNECRRLTILTNAPSVQSCTSNYLNGTVEDCCYYKHSVVAYEQKQSLYLDTKHYPDSVNVAYAMHPQAAKGKQHHIQCTIEYYKDNVINKSDDKIMSS